MTNGKTEIQVTTDYSVFKGILGNRKISKGHIFALTKSILKKNMLSSNPIIVNEKMQVIDGQHRLEVAKANKLPVYYVVAGESSLEDIQALNSTNKPWSGRDYADSYAALGKEAYIKVKQLVEKEGFTVGNAAKFVSGKMFSSHVWEDFKRGRLEVSKDPKVEEFTDLYIQLKPYVEARIWNDREFIRAVKQTIETVSLEQLIVDIEEQAVRIEYSPTTKDYLRQLENIINFKQRKNFTRLF